MAKLFEDVTNPQWPWKKETAISGQSSLEGLTPLQKENGKPTRVSGPKLRQDLPSGTPHAAFANSKLSMGGAFCDFPTGHPGNPPPTHPKDDPTRGPHKRMHPVVTDEVIHQAAKLLGAGKVARKLVHSCLLATGLTELQHMQQTYGALGQVVFRSWRFVAHQLPTTWWFGLVAWSSGGVSNKPYKNQGA